jgi:hypothetical protein
MLWLCVERDEGWDSAKTPTEAVGNEASLAEQRAVGAALWFLPYTTSKPSEKVAGHTETLSMRTLPAQPPAFTF